MCGTLGTKQWKCGNVKNELARYTHTNIQAISSNQTNNNLKFCKFFGYGVVLHHRGYRVSYARLHEHKSCKTDEEISDIS